MNRRGILLTVACVFAACSHPQIMSSPAPLKGKPTAPVSVRAELSSKSARLTVTFEQAATAAMVRVSGNDGLVVSGAPVLLENGTVEARDSRTFEVPFTPGSGASSLVVSVHGKFGGADRGRVISFGVGTASAIDVSDQVITTDDRERVKVMPVDGQ